MTPVPLTSPDFGVRAHSVYDLEVTLVKFIKQLVDPYRFDNPTLNLAQQPGAFPKSYDPDSPPVSYDPTARAQTLALKVAPRVERGRVPRTVTGEIAVDRLPDVPAILVQAVAATVSLADSHTSKNVTARILVNAYDENPDSGGYQDCTNIIEALEIALTSFGSGALNDAYPLIFPIEWKLIEEDTFPHYIAEMTTNWQLPAGRPMPDIDPWMLAPGESLEHRLERAPTQIEEFDP
jgi:hypothetical protein